MHRVNQYRSDVKLRKCYYRFVPAYGYLVVVAGWAIWGTAFFTAKGSVEPPKVVDRRARWGIMLAGVGYGLLWQGRFWERPLPVWRLAISIVFLLLACLLSWTGTRALGRQWRFDAGLSSDHEFVTSGPYRVVRHPIYASMLCLFLGTGLAIATLPCLAIAAVFFITGTEIRVRLEERLLASRFGDAFADYRRRVPAYIPFVR
jgi:protein-S-isoprenylcysteine O-methyltransferase Ste14